MEAVWEDQEYCRAEAGFLVYSLLAGRYRPHFPSDFEHTKEMGSRDWLRGAHVGMVSRHRLESLNTINYSPPPPQKKRNRLNIVCLKKIATNHRDVLGPPQDADHFVASDIGSKMELYKRAEWMDLEGNEPKPPRWPSGRL